MSKKVTVSQLKRTIGTCRKAGIVPFIQSSPGMAKTSAVRQVADEMGIGMIDWLRASQLDAVDLRGVPSVDFDAGVTKWMTPAFWPKSGEGILFLDEIRNGAMSVIVSMMQLTLDGRIAEYRLPPGWMVVCASNRTEDQCGVTKLPKSFDNRVMFLELVLSTPEWLDWAYTHPCIDMGEAELVPFFIDFRKDALSTFDPRSADPSFASPRSWELVMKIMAEKPDEDLIGPMVSGLVGDGLSAEFCAYRKIYRSLPKLEGIFMSPMDAKIPDEPTARAAICAGLAKQAAPSNIGAIIAYTGRLSREFQFMAVSLSRRLCPDIDDTRDMSKWMAANTAFMTAH